MRGAKTAVRLPPALRRLAIRVYESIRLRPLARLARACRKGLRVDWI